MTEAPPRRRRDEPGRGGGPAPRGRRGARARPPRPGPAAWGLAAATALVEAVLWGADAGLWGAPGWRQAAYHDGAFLPGLLGNWRPNHPAQPYAMWLTHALLHAGPGHLLGNLALMLWLAGEAERRLGEAGFALLYAVSVLGGAAGFALLGPEGASMVGASGAVHGLVGARLAWEERVRRRAGRAAAPVLWAALGVAALNGAVWVVEDGHLAWEAHAGGLAAGYLAARLMARAGLGGR